MFGSKEIVRGTAKIFNGHLLEAFDQGDDLEGLGEIIKHIPGAENGACKSLCMNWIAHHANDEPELFSDVARSMGSGHRRGGGCYAGVVMALNQMDYANAVRACGKPSDYHRAKDKFTDDFLRDHGIVRQMKITNDAVNLTSPGLKPGRSSLPVDTAYAWRMARAIKGKHSANYWSYKIISIHGSAGGHAVAAFVGADVVFFDPNYGIFYFEKAKDFVNWFGAPGGFLWVTRYVKHLGDHYVVKSYAQRI